MKKLNITVLLSLIFAFSINCGDDGKADTMKSITFSNSIDCVLIDDIFDPGVGSKCVPYPTGFTKDNSIILSYMTGRYGGWDVTRRESILTIVLKDCIELSYEVSYENISFKILLGKLE